jgi:hypothetical protein
MLSKIKDKKARSSHADLVTYIRVTGKAISKRTWYRRLKLLRDANIEINQTTIYELANLEIALPKLNLQDVQRYYVLKEKFNNFVTKHNIYTTLIQDCQQLQQFVFTHQW